MNNTEPRRATITISETPKENTLSIDVEFFPELNLQDDAFSGWHISFAPRLKPSTRKRNAMSDEARTNANKKLRPDKRCLQNGPPQRRTVSQACPVCGTVSKLRECRSAVIGGGKNRTAIRGRGRTTTRREK